MPSLILLRGLPGSGKSTFAENIAENNKYPVFSIDSYFINPISKKYVFEFEKNYLAYQHCESQTEQAMIQKSEKIIVDNTFTLDWEIEPYFKIAKKFNYSVFVLTVENYHGKKNTHGINEEQLKKMASKYKIKLM